jgi:hypothetical protein
MKGGVMEVQELKAELEVRRKNEFFIRKKIVEYCREQYGIEDFYAARDAFLGSYDDFCLCLCRQIPNANVEHLAHQLVAEWLNDYGINTRAMPMSFVVDSFCGNNRLKKSYARIPFLKRGRKGDIVCEKKMVVCRNARQSLDGMMLDKIQTEESQSLLDLHRNMRKMADLESVTTDVSDFFLFCLESCLRNGKRKPDYLYVQDGLKGRKVRLEKLNGDKLVRPSAEWYYMLYLLLFVDGKMGLLSTVDDDDIVDKWITEACAEIEAICGFRPLLIDAPKNVFIAGYKSELLEVPSWVLQGFWREKIGKCTHESIFQACQFFEKKIISLA